MASGGSGSVSFASETTPPTDRLGGGSLPQAGCANVGERTEKTVRRPASTAPTFAAVGVTVLLSLTPHALSAQQPTGEPEAEAPPMAVAEPQLAVAPRSPAYGWPEPGQIEPRGALQTKVGHGSLATLPSDIERVALADSGIARVQIISPLELLLTGLRPGRTTVYVWLADGRRFQYLLTVERDLDLLRRALGGVDPRIRVETTPDASAVVLYGEVDSDQMAREAEARAENLVRGAEIVNLLQFPGLAFSLQDRLVELLHDIDPRIRLRRIQVGPDPDVARDTFILEGQVRTMHDLVKAVTLAERQLGGTGSRVSAIDTDRVGSGRFRGFFGSGIGGFGGGVGSDAGRGGLADDRGRGNLAGAGRDPSSSGLLAQLARGQVVTSESGRVVSFLQLDEMPQVAVSIRVLEIDRVKTRKAGINFRIDGEHLSIGSYVSPQVDNLNFAGGGGPSVDGLTVSDAGNIVASFVDQTASILTAFDFLQQKQFARSVAEPTISTLSGELASVLVGGEIPIETAAVGAVAAVSGFFFQEFGVRLDIRPTVTVDHMVALEVAPSIIRPTAALAVGSVPGFQVQSVNTTATVPAGQSMVIGGLMSFEDGLEDRRLPGLGKVPLFRWKRKTRQERELVFVITPRLIAEMAPPEEPVEVRPLEEMTLPDLEWDEDRDDWRDRYEPRFLQPDGAPSSFVPIEIEVREPPEVVVVERQPAATVIQTAPPPVIEELPATERRALTGSFIIAETARPCLNLRPSPGFGDAPQDCLPPGTEVEVLWDAGGGWSRARLTDGREGWLAGSHLVPWDETEATAVPPGTTVVFYVALDAEPCLNVRPEPNFWQPPLDCLEPGTRVEVLERTGGWARVRVGAGWEAYEGWVAAGYLAESPEGGAEIGELDQPAGELETALRELRAELDGISRPDAAGGS